MFPAGVDSFGIVVNAADMRPSIPSSPTSRHEIEPDDITILALVSVVGRNMSKRSGTPAKSSELGRGRHQHSHDYVKPEEISIIGR